MQKKYGIITFHRAVNFGALLQAYALSQYILQNGMDCEIINYRCEYIDDMYEPFKIRKEKLLKSFVKLFLMGPILNKKRKRFQAFSERFLKISSEQYTKDNIAEANNIYSAFISGSDQVFSPKCVGFDPIYFLTFVENSNKKFSYAASIGAEKIPENLIDEFRNRLSDFNMISVREESGKKIISDVLRRESFVNLDPTFLLNKSDWGKACGKVSETKYIAVYTVIKPEKQFWDFIRRLSAEKGLKVIYINDSYLKKIKGITKKAAVSPECFLAYIKNADYVVTNSFHGTAFSIIFEKNFFVYSDLPEGKGTRIKNILELCNITGREIIDGENKNIDAQIDWQDVDRRISAEREKAANYLSEIERRVK